MTNYSKWDAKAAALERECEAEELREKAENDAALGLSEGPAGPPTAKAKEQLGELKTHSDEKKAIIESMENREVNFSRGPQEEPFVLTDVERKGVRLQDSRDCTFVVPADSGVLKLFVERCQNCCVRVQGQLRTSTIEVFKCQDLTLELQEALGALQVDDCKGAVKVAYREREHLGDIYHQNAPGLCVSWGGGGFASDIGSSEHVQYITRLGDSKCATEVHTTEVRRDSGDFPLSVPLPKGPQGQPEQEPPAKDEKQEAARLLAEQKKEEGNNAFRNSDFMQATAFYSQAVELDPSLHTVWANRAQCWLKLGNHDKALADATRCTEIKPDYAKGWFRKGISLHAVGRYTQAIPALLEAEKLDPSNKQIVDAVKMAQLMARKYNGDKPAES